MADHWIERVQCDVTLTAGKIVGSRHVELFLNFIRASCWNDNNQQQTHPDSSRTTVMGMEYYYSVYLITVAINFLFFYTPKDTIRYGTYVLCSVSLLSYHHWLSGQPSCRWLVSYSL